MSALKNISAPTSEEIIAALIEMAAADRAWRDARIRKAPERFALSQRFDEAAIRINSLREAARRAFADPLGWKYSQRHSFPHREVYIDHKRRRVAEVLHTYGPKSEIDAYAMLYKWNVTHLPWSWWNPRGDIYGNPCNSAVLTKRGAS